MACATAVGDTYCYDDPTHLTVMKTSLFFSGDGFTAYDSHGALLFRVDSYGPDSRDRDNIVLMDASGKALLTLRRKVRSPRRQKIESLLIVSSVFCLLMSTVAEPAPAVGRIHGGAERGAEAVL